MSVRLCVREPRGEPVQIADAVLRIQILGPFRASACQAELPLGPRKQCTLLALLALRAGERVTVEELAEALWGENLPASANALVHTYVARLRRVLEPDAPRHRRNNVISSARGGYRLNVRDEQLDLQAFRTLTRQALALISLRQWEAGWQVFDRAMRAWSDPFLKDLTALLPDHPAIELLRRELVGAALEYVRLGLEHGRACLVLPIAERLALVEPFNEVVQAHCLQALTRTGQRTAALARYTEVQARLRTELNVEPGPQLAAARAEAIEARAEQWSDDVPAGSSRPPWRGPGSVVDDLVGREEDLTRLCGLLRRHRLVTLTGPVGAGKTALALALAEAVRGGYGGGVWVVELSGTASLRGVVDAVAAVLGGTGPSRHVPAGSMSDAAGQPQLLLVLDNAELVIDETAEFVNELLRSSSGIRVVVTSREILGLAYEAVHQVRPLAVGEQDRGNPRRLMESPAVRLFARRAVQLSPTFQLSESNALLVAAICRRVDGLPLAIELAAACLRTDPLRLLLNRLRDPLYALRSTWRGGPRHHGSLYAAAHRSMELLDEAERRCFASLGLVDGEFCVEMAREARRMLPGDDDVPLLLNRLVDKSLLEVCSNPLGRRYRMLRVSRALARDTLNRLGHPPRPSAAGHCIPGC
ncbi:transcriptional regulator [Micromonospora endophytica]|uniref:Transcriptional regulator n=1 Tax=Micromonospora endophytica TaxID=515350 RepID=A0A2W2DLS2_9ACTN|nr:transcriptional regulator [Micromonospora endophytica]RIW49478.1 AfsR/SARP family transcriptional regulator [Micromonospora endophytica]